MEENQANPGTVKVKRTRSRKLELGDMYLLRYDSKKRAVSLLQAKMHRERTQSRKMKSVGDYDSGLGGLLSDLKKDFIEMQKMVEVEPKIYQRIKKKRRIAKEINRKSYKFGAFEKYLKQMSKDFEKERIISQKMHLAKR